MSTTVEPLPHLRFEIPEAARILRISRATLYERIREGLITTQKDGRRTFITDAASLSVGPTAVSVLGRRVLSDLRKRLSPEVAMDEEAATHGRVAE